MLSKWLTGRGKVDVKDAEKQNGGGKKKLDTIQSVVWCNAFSLQVFKCCQRRNQKKKKNFFYPGQRLFTVIAICLNSSFL